MLVRLGSVPGPGPCFSCPLQFNIWSPEYIPGGVFEPPEFHPNDIHKKNLKPLRCWLPDHTADKLEPWVNGTAFIWDDEKVHALQQQPECLNPASPQPVGALNPPRGQALGT